MVTTHGTPNIICHDKLLLLLLLLLFHQIKLKIKTEIKTIKSYVDIKLTHV
jgi:hypothetical protein